MGDIEERGSGFDPQKKNMVFLIMRSNDILQVHREKIADLCDQEYGILALVMNDTFNKHSRVLPGGYLPKWYPQSWETE